MKQISIDELDFDKVKENLKAFLRTQSEFDSYDFEGSALSILLDVLAYNTTYNASYLNMAINEAFIDSSSKRASLISHAKTLGYTANSARAATATLDVIVRLPVTDTTTALTIPKGTIFSGTIENTNYQFVTLTDYSAQIGDGEFLFEGIQVKEGTLLNYTYTVSPESKYTVPTEKLDLTTLSVLVRESFSSSETIKFTQAGDLFKIKSTDAIYFVKQRSDKFYEIFFGSDGIGRSLSNGNIVRLEYLESSGEEANGANLFVYQSGFRSDAQIEVTTVQAAIGGTPTESNESIRFNAPRSYITQNRAVTAADYENLLLQQYPNIESIHAWGGQDNIPKVYGKVFICVKPRGMTKFSTIEKQSMEKSLINNRGVVSINPVIVDPLFMNVELNCAVYYNQNSTKWTAGQLQTFIGSRIKEYGATLNRFDSVFRYSKISAAIDGVDPAGIVSNAISLRVRCPVDALYNSNSQYTQTVGNPISAGSFFSTRFYISDFLDRAYIRDNSAGILQMYSENIDGIAEFYSNVGTIDYGSGSWNIPKLNIIKLHDSLLEFVFIPKSNDVVSNRNIIVSIPEELTQVNMISDNIANGSEQGAFVFTNVR